MRRVISVWFPFWATDRLRRLLSKQQADTPLLPGPLVTAAHDGRRRVIASADQDATAIGLRPGMAMAHALALVPGLHVAEATPHADDDALRRLALWCHRYTPLVAPCPPDGLWLDIAGTAHLFGGESVLLTTLLERMHRDGIHANAAIADTHAAADALARHRSGTIAPPRDQLAAIASLPVACLRLPDEVEATLRRLGIETVADLARTPRPSIIRRFGPAPGLRLDQARGTVEEILIPLKPEHLLQSREAFLEPLLTAEALAIAIDRLVQPLCAEMERNALGARRLDLMFERLDHHVVTLCVGTVRATRHPGHLFQLLAERLDTVDPGLGIEAMRLVVPLTEPLQWEQEESGAAPGTLARLVDRLCNRLGSDKVYRAAPVETALPENLVRPATPNLPFLTPAEPDSPHQSPPPRRSSTPDEVTPTEPAPPPVAAPRPHALAIIAPTPRTSSSALPAPSPSAPTPSTPTPSVPAPSTSAPSTPALPGAANPASRRTSLKLVTVTSDSVTSEQDPRPFPARRRLALRLVPGILEPSRDEASHPPSDTPPHEAGLVLPWRKPSPKPPRPQVGSSRTWPSHLRPPARLLAPPRPVLAMASLPDQAPITFTWRRRHRVVRSEGPERIHEAWWTGHGGNDLIRDYFQVEVEGGQRFWLFRRGNGIDLRTGNLAWFLHGLF